MSTKLKTKKHVKRSLQNLKYTASNPATELSGVVTTVTNITDSTLPFDFLPPHGKVMTPGKSLTFAGILAEQFKTGGGRDNQRKVVAYNNAIANKLIQVSTGSNQIVYCAVGANVVIQKGDLVWLNTSAVEPASTFTWSSDLATTQVNFKAKFMGVALAAHAAGSAVANFPVDISNDAIHTYACTSETHEVGDTLGLAKASGNALQNQTLVKAVAASSIARCRVRNTSASTSVSVTFNSAYRN